LNLAHTSHLRACSEVLFSAAIEARWLAYQGARDAQIADLMYAVHNIPHLMLDWDRCDVNLLRRILADYDTKWAGHGLCLNKTYDAALSEGDAGTPQ